MATKTRSKNTSSPPPLSRRPSGASSVGTKSTTSSGGSRPGLSKVVKKTLAKDIQHKRGGTHKLKGSKALQKLLDNSNRVDTCKEVGHPIRRQISNKVDKWKQHTPDQWKSRVLFKYNISEEPSSSSEEDKDDSSVSSLEEDIVEVSKESPTIISLKKKAATKTITKATPKPKATPKSKASPNEDKPSPIHEDRPSNPIQIETSKEQNKDGTTMTSNYRTHLLLFAVLCLNFSSASSHNIDSLCPCHIRCDHCECLEAGRQP